MKTTSFFIALVATVLLYPQMGIASVLFGTAAGIFAFYLALVYKETDAEEKRQGIALTFGMIIFFSVLFYIIILDNRTVVTDYNRNTGVYPHYIESTEAMIIALLTGFISASISYLIMRLTSKNSRMVRIQSQSNRKLSHSS